MALPSPRALSARLSAWRPVLSEREVAAWTGLSPRRWRALAGAFPELPRQPGPGAARARRRMAELALRALSGGKWNPAWEGPEPPRGPAAYVTAHIGSLLSLRYVLRARGIPAASVIAPFNFDRPDPAAKDAVFDRRFPLEFPHVVSSRETHRLRALLRRGSLILAADLPARESFSARLLGRAVALDPRPFRLARLARVPCVPIFLTLRGRRWTVASGPPLPEGERGREIFARAFAEAASRAPLDLDGVVYANRYLREAP